MQFLPTCGVQGLKLRIKRGISPLLLDFLSIIFLPFKFHHFQRKFWGIQIADGLLKRYLNNPNNGWAWHFYTRALIFSIQCSYEGYYFGGKIKGDASPSAICDWYDWHRSSWRTTPHKQKKKNLSPVLVRYPILRIVSVSCLLVNLWCHSATRIRNLIVDFLFVFVFLSFSLSLCFLFNIQRKISTSLTLWNRSRHLVMLSISKYLWSSICKTCLHYNK